MTEIPDQGSKWGLTQPKDIKQSQLRQKSDTLLLWGKKKTINQYSLNEIHQDFPVQTIISFWEGQTA